MKTMIDFIAESNRIEGIHREPTPAEIAEMERFLELPRLTVEDVVQFVSVYQPNAVLRNKTTIHGVRVGNHVAPASGPEIEERLKKLLHRASQHDGPTAYTIHQHYEHLHPFTDGNGRSGRAVWAWQMTDRLGVDAMDAVYARGFLHSWYYQSLENWRSQ